jgi:hypothetical protein
LISEISVSGHYDFKPRSFGDSQQFTVFQFVPPPRAGLGAGVVIDPIPGKCARRI